jgi:hypothetical protein
MVAAGLHSNRSIPLTATTRSHSNEEVKMRQVIVLLTACVAAACASPAPDTGVSPTPELTTAGFAETAPMDLADNSCSDRAPIWLTLHYTTSNGALQGEWTPILNIETYQIEISYSRDGIQPWRVVAAFDTNRTEFRYVDRENGGRYLVRVRVKNRCDRVGAWSTQLNVMIDDGPDDEGPSEEQYYGDR